MFVVGALTATIILGMLLWFGRTKVASLFSAGYEYQHRPVVLLRDFQIYQNGVAVGVLRAGAQVDFVGLDKTSPIENYSIMFGWENRGVDRDKLLKDATSSKRMFSEIRSQ